MVIEAQPSQFEGSQFSKRKKNVLCRTLEGTLAELSCLSNVPRADAHVVFIHGLRRPGFKSLDVFRNSSRIWPLWLTADIDNLDIWSVNHDSAPSRWFGASMPRTDRASNLLASFLSEERLRQGNIYFVTHSFGGLVFEQLLRLASDRSSSDGDAKSFVTRINKVIFLGTPHHGAELATFARIFRIIFRPSSATEGLARNDPNLRELNQWYRRYAPEAGITTRALVEARNTLLGRVVKPDSADPGLFSDPIPVDADHYGLASPKSKESEIYRLVRDFLARPAPNFRPRTMVPATTIDAIATDVSKNSAILEQITHQLFAAPISEARPARFPTYLVDIEIEKRMSDFGKPVSSPVPTMLSRHQD